MLTFRLYYLVDKDSELGYTYAAVSEQSKHAILIGEEFVSIDRYDGIGDKELILESYVATSRTFTFDFEKFYQLHISVNSGSSSSLVVVFVEHICF